MTRCVARKRHYAEATPCGNDLIGTKPAINSRWNVAKDTSPDGFEESASSTPATVGVVARDVILIPPWSPHFGTSEFLNLGRSQCVIQMAVSEEDADDIGPAKSSLREGCSKRIEA